MSKQKGYIDDWRRIIELLLEKYSELPDKIKNWIPLKRVGYLFPYGMF